MGAAFVSNQPKTEEEISACKDVIEACPVQAIGDDGE
ncbi:MAG: ferredoxin [Alphaproteobacteria bacterium]